jgi:hypothetical protein
MIWFQHIAYALSPALNGLHDTETKERLITCSNAASSAALLARLATKQNERRVLALENTNILRANYFIIIPLQYMVMLLQLKLDLLAV